MPAAAPTWSTVTLLVGTLALTSTAPGCGRRAVDPSPTSAVPAPGAGPAPRLSATGLYQGAGVTRVHPKLLSFAPQYPLWTDGAEKSRWIQLPAGTSIDASDPDVWIFPAGTRLWKEFRFGGRRVETRTMERLADGSWRYATYLWLPDESDAVLAPAEGTTVPVSGAAGRHEIPSEADCRSCHEGRTTPVLGFSALQLSPDRDPGAVHAEPAREGDVNLTALVERGLVRGLPPELVATPPRIDAPTPTARAALGYLHGNCGGCHNREGPLASVGLVLAQPASGDGADEVLASALARPSRFRLADRPDAEQRLAPGRPEASVLALRMHARDPAVQMPPMGRLTVDEEALALIERWIDQDLAAASALAATTTKEPKP